MSGVNVQRLMGAAMVVETAPPADDADRAPDAVESLAMDAGPDSVGKGQQVFDPAGDRLVIGGRRRDGIASGRQAET